MKECIFCKIVGGSIPSFTVYETNTTLAFLDINPVAKGHTLDIPKSSNCSNIFDISSSDWSEVMETVRIVAIALEKSLGCDGVNLMMNTTVSMPAKSCSIRMYTSFRASKEMDSHSGHMAHIPTAKHVRFRK